MENLFEMKFDPKEVNAISNTALALVGDGVYELLVRTYLCTKGDRTVLKLHNDTVNLVKATTQAKFAMALKPHLTEAEQDYFRRGKNAHTHAAPKSASPKEYALATGLECLFGALYLLGQTHRINQLFAIIMED